MQVLVKPIYLWLYLRPWLVIKPLTKKLMSWFSVKVHCTYLETIILYSCIRYPNMQLYSMGVARQKICPLKAIVMKILLIVGTQTVCEAHSF